MIPSPRFSSLHLLYDKQRGVQVHLEQVPNINQVGAQAVQHQAPAPDSGKVFFMDTELSVSAEITQKVQTLEKRCNPSAYDLQSTLQELIPLITRKILQPYTNAYQENKEALVGYQGIAKSKTTFNLLSKVISYGGPVTHTDTSAGSQPAQRLDQFPRSTAWKADPKWLPNAPIATLTRDVSSTSIRMPVPQAIGVRHWFLPMQGKHSGL
jgi:hypothetical protein